MILENKINQTQKDMLHDFSDIELSLKINLIEGQNKMVVNNCGGYTGRDG